MLFICAIRDAAIQAYLRPIFVTAPGQAMRSFQDEVQTPRENNDLNKHPGDFDLYQLGKWDETSGAFTPSDPILLLRGTDVSIKRTE